MNRPSSRTEQGKQGWTSRRCWYNLTMLTIDKGLYILLIEARGEIKVGKLGKFWFNGRYLYVGSARGPGGFKRVERHLAIASAPGKRERPRRWHIDYLLEAGKLLQVWLLPDPGLTECELVQRLIARGARPAVPGFGASDSPCETHLLRAEGAIHQLGLAEGGVVSVLEL